MKKTVAFWLVCSVFNFGALNANIQYENAYHWTNLHLSPRSQAADAMGFAMLGPLALPCAIFGTGFMEYGWTLKFSPAIPEKERQ